MQNQAKIRDVNGEDEDTISENQKENLGNLNKDDEKEYQKDRRSSASQVTGTARTSQLPSLKQHIPEELTNREEDIKEKK